MAVQFRALILILTLIAMGCASSGGGRAPAQAAADDESVFGASDQVRQTAHEIFADRKATERVYRESDPADVKPQVRRDTHAKTHACVRAEFEVKAAGPGIFSSPGAKYNAWIRFANGVGQIKYDLVGDARAMSIKVMGVKGDKTLQSSPDEELYTQDFIMNNGPTFFLDGAKDSKEFFDTELKGETALKLYIGESFVPFVLSERKKLVFNLALFASKVEPNLLTASYWSGTPYQFGKGDKNIVRYIARPCQATNVASFRGLPTLNANETKYKNEMNKYFKRYSPLLGNPDYPDLGEIKQSMFVIQAKAALGLEQTYTPSLNPDNRNYLRDNLVADFKDGHAGCFDFGVETYVDENSTPKELPTVMWKTTTTWLAQVHIDANQPEAASDKQIAFCEALSFNPWHAMVDNKPAGELNALRGMIYRAMSSYRHASNGIGGGEPLDDFSMILANPSQARAHYEK